MLFVEEVIEVVEVEVVDVTLRYYIRKRPCLDGGAGGDCGN